MIFSFATLPDVHDHPGVGIYGAPDSLQHRAAGAVDELPMELDIQRFCFAGGCIFCQPAKTAENLFQRVNGLRVPRFEYQTSGASLQEG